MTCFCFFQVGDVTLCLHVDGCDPIETKKQVIGNTAENYFNLTVNI